MSDADLLPHREAGYNNQAMPAISVPTHRRAGSLRSKRLLSLAGDGTLAEQMRRGNELAFEIAFERHGGAVLSFCRHMLGSAEEAEDAVQQTFASAWRDLEHGGDRELVLKPWLFTIARNRCVSMLRARREQRELPELATAGLSEEIERRAELRELLGDIGELPAEQREALLLSELGDLSHNAVAGVLGCEVARVKSLVFRARSALIARREARATPCEEIREQLANLRGGALRRNELRLHLRECPGCRAYRDEVKHQRELLAAALPVTPGAGLELSVLAAAGIGGGGAAIGGAAAGGIAAAGVGATIGGAGSMLLTKLALVGLLAGGGVAAGTLLVDDPGSGGRGTPEGMHERGSAGGQAATRRERDAPGPAAQTPAAAGPRRAQEPVKTNGGGVGAGQGPQRFATPPGQGVGRKRGRKLGHEKPAAPPREAPSGPRAQGRGPIEKPAGSGPVKRGPATVKVPAPKPPGAATPKIAAPTPREPARVPAPQRPPAVLSGKEKRPKS
jgi:RNA polymerase sigma factor (sigma-70 family)